MWLNQCGEFEGNFRDSLLFSFTVSALKSPLDISFFRSIGPISLLSYLRNLVESSLSVQCNRTLTRTVWCKKAICHFECEV